MRRTIGLLFGLSLAALPLAARAYDWAEAAGDDPQFAASKAICRRLQGLEAPPADRPDAAMAAQLKDCSSETLYYGIGVPADPERARLCAFVEQQKDLGGLGGTAMLMTVYANGLGARRDLDLATAYACRIEGAPAESDGRVLHLQRLKAEGWDGHDFSFCDDITSGYAGGLCAVHAAAIEDAKRAQAAAGLTQGWSAAETRAFATLQKAKDAYISTSVDNEVDLSGTARVAFEVEQQQALEEQFLATLKQLEAGAAPHEAASYAAADQRLNLLWKQVMAAEDPFWGTVTKEGIRTAQRAWLRYRDAWVAFAAVRFPGIPADDLRALLTEQRSKLLEDFAG